MLKNWVRDFTVFCVWGFNDFAFRKLETGLFMSLSSEIEWTWQSNCRFIEGKAKNSCWKNCEVVIFRLYIKTILKLCDRPSQIYLLVVGWFPRLFGSNSLFWLWYFSMFFPMQGDFHEGLGSFFSVQVTILERMTTRRGLIWEPDYVCSISGVCKDSVCEGLG